MYCVNCGKKNTKTAKFCQSCGMAVGKAHEEDGKKEEVVEQIETEEGRSYLVGKIREKSLKRLYFGCALVFVSFVILLTQLNYISNILSGPRSITPETLESEILGGNITDLNVAVALQPDSVYSAGYTHVTQTVNENTNQVESETTDGQYYLTTLGKHIVVLEGTPNQTPTGTFNGVVIPLPADLQNKLVADFNNDPKLQRLGSYILPYEISNKGIFGLDQVWYLLIGLGLLIWGGIIVIRRLNDIDDKNHYIYKIAEAAGYKSVDDMSNDFLKTKDTKSVEIGSYHLNHKFLYTDGYFSFHVFPLSQLFWIYKGIVKKSVNFIPTGKDYKVVLHFRPNMQVSIKESENDVDQHLYIIASLCPYAKLGYR